MKRQAVLWNRLDAPGHDACRIVQRTDGWEIEGRAVFAHAGEIACLSYGIRCAGDWSTRSARVAGWVGSRDIALEVRRSGDGDWTIDGAPLLESSGLHDVDLGFTPASNTNAIRRLDLAVGEDVGTMAVWLDTEDWTVKTLYQTYRRTSPTTYDYASPAHGYSAELVTNAFGVVVRYPKLWVAADAAA